MLNKAGLKAFKMLNDVSLEQEVKQKLMKDFQLAVVNESESAALENLKKEIQRRVMI